MNNYIFTLIGKIKLWFRNFRLIGHDQNFYNTVIDVMKGPPMPRFNLVLLFCLCGVPNALGASDTATPADQPPTSPSAVNILAYGVRTDGSADCTAAFQKALDDMAGRNGGVVEVPAGRYRFDGSLIIPENVALKETFLYSPSHYGERSFGCQPPNRGSVLEVYGGKGNESGNPFITIQSSAVVQGFVVVYPEQQHDAEAPVPSPTPLRCVTTIPR